MISWKLKTHNYGPIGLDIGHNNIKMIQLETNGPMISVVDAAKAIVGVNISSDFKQRKEYITSAIKTMLAKGNFKGREVVSSMPNDQIRMTSIRLGRTETEKIEEILRREVTNRFAYHPDKDSINYMFAGSVRHGDEIKNEVILFATKDETVRNHIDTLEQVELRPVGIDPVPCALYRSFRRMLRRQEDREKTDVFIDIGGSSTTVVFGRDEDISFVKNIMIGTENINREIAQRLDIEVSEAEMLRNRLWRRTRISNSADSDEGLLDKDNDLTHQEDIDPSTRQIMVDAIGSVAEELAKEISLCFRYYTVTFRGKRVERATFTGGGAYENILLNVLRRQMALSVEVAEPFDGIDITKVNFNGDRRGLLCEWAVAVGLGLKNWEPGESIRKKVEK